MTIVESFKAPFPVYQFDSIEIKSGIEFEEKDEVRKLFKFIHVLGGSSTMGKINSVSLFDEFINLDRLFLT